MLRRMSITRREFFVRSAPLGALPFLPEKCDDLFVQEEPPFLHGVASGDPLARAVILWTRVTPSPQAPEAVRVDWVIATDPELEHVARRGTVVTSAERDYTVKVDVDRLRPGTTYYYRFASVGHASILGRTRTLPTGSVERVRLACTSCSNYPFGFFNAYRLIGQRADLDAVVHLGDYLYEYANGEFGDGTALGRIPEPDHEIVSLDDYRKRHAQYKTDPDLQEAHRQHPFIVVWDDHEVTNDAWTGGAQNHQPETEGDWQARKLAALTAYMEWMPIREGSHDSKGRIYRSFRVGNLVDLIMLDTRLAGRDEQLSDPCDPATADPTRQLLGEEQEAWFVRELTKSQKRSTHWRLVGQQVMFAQLVNATEQGVCAFNTDQWDGYAASRARVLEAFADHSIDNVVILTGDIHSSWAMDITGNPFDPSQYDGASGRGSLAVEFVTPGVTSPAIEDPLTAAALAQQVLATHPHMKFVELNRRGYLLLDVSPERVQAEWYHLVTIAEPLADEDLAGVFVTESGTAHVVAGSEPAPERLDAPALAPDLVPVA